jgi:hypothetical protein
MRNRALALYDGFYRYVGTSMIADLYCVFTCDIY